VSVCGESPSCFRSRFRREPVATLAALARFFGLEATSREIEQAVARCTAVDSKQPELPFSRESWLRRQQAAARAHGEELRASLDWTDRNFPDFHALRSPASPLE